MPKKHLGRYHTMIKNKRAYLLEMWRSSKNRWVVLQVDDNINDLRLLKESFNNLFPSVQYRVREK